MPPASLRSVFINTPFDLRYEPLFVTLVGTLVFVGHWPRCVLEVPETGDGRLARIYRLISSCRMSFHDLSRVGTPARFNMPFELGLACSVKLASGQHDVFVLDAKPYRIDRTLSDYKGRDPLIHYGRCDDLAAAVVDVFDPKFVPDVGELWSATRELRQSARTLKKKWKSPTVFRPAVFHALSTLATEIAVTRGFVAP